MLEEWRATEPGAGPDATEEVVTLPGRPADLAGADAVRYVTEVADPRSGDDDVAVLSLDGCYAHAEVEVSGSVVGGADGPVTHDAYFAPLRIPFRPTDDEVRIAVTCEAPRDRFGGLFDTDAVPAEASVPGVWWTADLASRALPYVEDVQVRPEVTEAGATLHVRTTVLAAEQLSDRITYSLKPAGELTTRGTMNRGAVETDGPGRTTVEHEIEVRDPALWWPRGHGDQHRYELRAKLGDSERTVTTGIRSVSWDDGDLLVNGQSVPVRGVNLTTAAEADVDRAVACNANLVRGHAQVLPPAVYEACDEAGILVWQDLPLTGPGSFDRDRATALARRLVAERAHHPSLVALAVHDDPTETFESGLGSGILDGLRRRWRAWRSGYDAATARAVADAVEAPVPVFPVVGDPGTEADARRLYPGWDYGEAGDADALLDRYPALVVAEFGAGALGSEAVDDAAGFDRAKHDVRVSDSADPATSQAYQADVVGTVAETFRRRGTDAIAYALRDTDAAGMGVYAVDGEAKAAQSALARAYEPVQAFLAEPGRGSTPVVVRNDLPRAFSGELRWTAGDSEGVQDVTVDATGRWESEPIDVPGDAESVTLEVSVGAGTVRNEYEVS